MQRAPARQDCEKMIVVLIVGLFATWICCQIMVMMVIVVVRVYGNFLVADSSHVNENRMLVLEFFIVDRHFTQQKLVSLGTSFKLEIVISIVLWWTIHHV